MRWALLGPTPGSRPSSSIRSWTTPSYTRRQPTGSAPIPPGRAGRGVPQAHGLDTSRRGASRAWPKRPNPSCGPRARPRRRSCRSVTPSCVAGALEDLPALHAAVVASKAHLVPFMPWAVHATAEDVSGSDGYLAGAVTKWVDRTTFDYAIIDADGAISGSCGLMGRIAPGSLEIGYWVHVDRTRRGLATPGCRSPHRRPDWPSRMWRRSRSTMTARTSRAVACRNGWGTCVCASSRPASRQPPAPGCTSSGAMRRDAWPSSAGAALLAGVRA